MRSRTRPARRRNGLPAAAGGPKRGLVGWKAPAAKMSAAENPLRLSYSSALAGPGEIGSSQSSALGRPTSPPCPLSSSGPIPFLEPCRPCLARFAWAAKPQPAYVP